MGKTDYSDLYPYGHRFNSTTKKTEVINIITQEVLATYEPTDIQGVADKLNELTGKKKAA